MIKIKIYYVHSGYVKYDNSFVPESDYLYCVYFFGLLIHSVNVRGLSKELAERMFGDKIIYPEEK